MNSYIVKNISHFCNVSVNKCSSISASKIGFYDLTFVLKGSMTYIIDDEEYVMEKNDAIFIRPGSLRKRLAGTKPVSYVSFNFEIFSEADIPLEVFMKNSIGNDIRSLLSTFSQVHISPLYHSEEKIMNLLNYILFELLDVIDCKKNNVHVAKIIKYINENLSRTVTLRDVSEYVHLSKEYTAYIFKKEMNKTVTEYINERKMLLAKDMIKTGKMSLIDVSENLGYENYSYFSRVFKKYFNTSPIKLYKLAK
ncbi:MAG: AraC family transcriptional regulator [Clostridia bacterium]|nr:AraC family transcriptional regulator [Clostridia bacterium]